MDLEILKTTDYELEYYVVDKVPPKVGKTQLNCKTRTGLVTKAAQLELVMPDQVVTTVKSRK